MITVRSANVGENTQVHPADPKLVDLPVRGAEAGITALLDVLNNNGRPRSSMTIRYRFGSAAR